MISARCTYDGGHFSDRYHESLPSRFAPGYDNRRVNLTLLFGDRWSVEAAPSGARAPGAGATAAGGGGAADKAAVEGQQAQQAPAAGAAPAGGAGGDGWEVFN